MIPTSTDIRDNIFIQSLKDQIAQCKREVAQAQQVEEQVRKALDKLAKEVSQLMWGEDGGKVQGKRVDLALLYGKKTEAWNRIRAAKGALALAQGKLYQAQHPEEFLFRRRYYRDDEED